MSNMKRIVILLLVLCAATLSGCARGEAVPEETVENVALEKDNKYTCSFDGVQHDFIVDLPEKTEGAPLVMMLHGFGDSAEGMRNTVHFEEKANPLGYAVVYVTGTPDPNDARSAACWNSGISAGISASDNRDVEFLCALARYLQDEYSLDKKRTFAVGFSNGAIMTHRLAMEAPGTFAAAVSVAGKMRESIWEAKNEKNSVGFFQITGEKDELVPKHSDGSAKYTKEPAIEDVVDYWAVSNGLEQTGTREIGSGSELTVYTGGGSAKQVWSLFVKNAHHSWPVEQLNGFDANDIILEFLETQ